MKREKNRETFYKHIHFCYSNANCDKWLDTVYTNCVFVNTLNETLKKHKKGSVVLINALPANIIKNLIYQIRLTYLIIEFQKISQDLFEWVKVVKLNYQIKQVVT